MRLRIKGVLWNSLGLVDPTAYHLALSCFYLGKGVEETRDLLSRGSSDPEVLYVMETAAFSGLDPTSDRIEKA